ncbi:hypothetical protein ABPG72_000923 [Tetrahymena utriculariae]
MHKLALAIIKNCLKKITLSLRQTEMDRLTNGANSKNLLHNQNRVIDYGEEALSKNYNRSLLRIQCFPLPAFYPQIQNIPIDQDIQKKILGLRKQRKQDRQVFYMIFIQLLLILLNRKYLENQFLLQKGVCYHIQVSEQMNLVKFTSKSFN